MAGVLHYFNIENGQQGFLDRIVKKMHDQDL
jgi:hypothetical protein